MKKALFVVFVLIGAIMLSSCGFKTPPDMVALQIGAGAEPAKIKDCKGPNERQWFWQTNDKYVYFPTSEREWDATGQKGSDSGKFSSVTKDSVEMEIPVTIRFTLKTDCTDLKNFYTRYARRYGASFDNNGDYNDQWVTLLRKLVADPSDQTLDRIVQGYNWRDVWQNPQVKVAIEKEMNDNLQSSNSLLVQTAKGEFFDGISILIGSPQPKNEELKKAVALEQTKVAQAQSEEAQARADAAKANAQLAVSRAEAAKQRAEIDGYPSIDAYLKSKAIEKGMNPFQPTYIWGGSQTGGQ